MASLYSRRSMKGFPVMKSLSFSIFMNWQFIHYVGKHYPCPPFTEQGDLALIYRSYFCVDWVNISVCSWSGVWWARIYVRCRTEVKWSREKILQHSAFGSDWHSQIARKSHGKNWTHGIGNVMKYINLWTRKIAHWWEGVEPEVVRLGWIRRQ